MRHKLFLETALGSNEMESLKFYGWSIKSGLNYLSIESLDRKWVDIEKRRHIVMLFGSGRGIRRRLKRVIIASC